MALTGKFTFRRSLTGKIMLQVEEEVKPLWRRSRPGAMKRRWRDATLIDLAAPAMRALIDLRMKPQFVAQTYYAPSERTLVPRERDAPGLDLDAVQHADGEVRRVAH